MNKEEIIKNYGLIFYKQNFDEHGEIKTKERGNDTIRENAYLHALNIDKCPRDDTRKAAIKQRHAYLYACYVDKIIKE